MHFECFFGEPTDEIEGFVDNNTDLNKIKICGYLLFVLSLLFYKYSK